MAKKKKAPKTRLEIIGEVSGIVEHRPLPEDIAPQVRNDFMLLEKYEQMTGTPGWLDFIKYFETDIEEVRSIIDQRDPHLDDERKEHIKACKDLDKKQNFIEKLMKPLMDAYNNFKTELANNELLYAQFPYDISIRSITGRGKLIQIETRK